MIADWDAWAKRADVDPWTGPKRNDWGAEITPKKDQNKKKSADKQKKQPQT
jgi:hypothetical protein